MHGLGTYVYSYNDIYREKPNDIGWFLWSVEFSACHDTQNKEISQVCQV